MICPRCRSANITVHRHGDYNSYMLMRGMIPKLAVLLGKLVGNASREKYGDNYVCLECGHKWHSQQTALKGQYKKCRKQYLGAESVSVAALGEAWINLDENEVVLHRSSSTSYRIPYDKLTDVSYQENLGPLYGWLSLRDKAHSRARLPQTFAEAQNDQLTIFYDFGCEKGFYQVYSALRAIIEENKKAGLL